MASYETAINNNSKSNFIKFPQKLISAHFKTLKAGLFSLELEQLKMFMFKLNIVGFTEFWKQ